MSEPVRGECAICDRIIEEWEDYYEFPQGYKPLLVCSNCVADYEKTGTYQQQQTTISGYHAYPEPPQANVCVFCNDGPCTLLCEPPADEREYVRQFRDGAFDEWLAGYVTVDTGDPISIDLPIHKHFTFGRLFERLLEGAE